jgi:pimeloyl-ACP methyl ester carboxylesterase
MKETNTAVAIPSDSAATCRRVGLFLGQLSLDEALQRFEREAVRGECRTGRYRCRYYLWGEGAPLVFVPGLSDDAVSFVLPIALLSRHFRCIAYDLPAGRSDGARLGRYCHADLVADLRALLDSLHIERAYLFGSSFGSTITLAALRAHPERFPRAVLQGGFAHRPLAPAEVLLARLARGLPGCVGSLPFRDPMLRPGHYAPFAARPPEVWHFMLHRWGKLPIAALAQRALLLHRIDLRPILPVLRQPVLLVCGDGDHLVGQACEDVLLRGLPQATRVELCHCGHVPQFTHPEVLAEVVRRFLLPPYAL